jgi:taurine dioxygenase
MYRFPVGARRLDRLARGKTATEFRKVEVKPLGLLLGAEIGGLDLSAPMDSETFAELDAAFQEWKVIVLRGQNVSREQFLVLAEHWGTVVEDSLANQVANGGVIRPLENAVDNIAVFTRDKYTQGLENIWHTDGSYRPTPILGTMLFAIDVPPIGGDTMFADMGAAYDNLDEDLRARVENLWAVHDWSIGGYSRKYDSDLERYRQVVPPVRHAVAIDHPRTGRRTLFTNRGFTSHILGLDPEEGDHVLDVLTRQADVPEYQLRIRWEPGMVVFWDNLAVQHYAVNDFWPQQRTMMRATIQGSWTMGAPELRRAEPAPG